MTDKKVAVNGGIGFLPLLCIVFITLKLTGVINWSWWLVLLPLYGPLALILVGIAIFVLIVAVVELINSGGAK